MSIIGLINHSSSIILVADSIVTNLQTGKSRNDQKIYEMGDDDSYITAIGSASLFSFLDYQYFHNFIKKSALTLKNFKDRETIKQIFSQIYKYQNHIAYIFVANRTECIIWTISAKKLIPKDENDYTYELKSLNPKEYVIYYGASIVKQKYLEDITEMSIIRNIKKYNASNFEKLGYKVDDIFSYVILPSNQKDKVIYKCTNCKIGRRKIGGLKSKIEIIRNCIYTYYKKMYIV